MSYFDYQAESEGRRADRMRELHEKRAERFAAELRKAPVDFHSVEKVASREEAARDHARHNESELARMLARAEADEAR